jgi:mono/diheme cytochrome c family protein
VRAAFLFLIAAVSFPTGAFAQDVLTRVADVFARTCATPYCHGPNGAGGAAPKLAGRGFDEAHIASVTRAGLPGTAMQGYGSTLARADFNAVVAYVANLNGIEPRTGTNAAEPKLSPEASRGRDLFFDSVRGVERCATCHQVQGLGIAIASITKIPSVIAGLREPEMPNVRTARVGADRFPTLIVSEGGKRTVLYDLSILPPVLRTINSGDVGIGDYNAWLHSTVTKAYSDSELASILAFLRSAFPGLVLLTPGARP